MRNFSESETHENAILSDISVLTEIGIYPKEVKKIKPAWEFAGFQEIFIRRGFLLAKMH